MALTLSSSANKSGVKRRRSVDSCSSDKENRGLNRSNPFLTPDTKLSALFDEEYYLEKILKHLIEDGLHECRRVCRFWKEVCDRLPVRLSLGCASILLPIAAQKFPNADALDVILDGSTKGGDFRSCVPFKKMTRLTLGVAGLYRLPENWKPDFKRLTALKSLELCSTVLSCGDVFSSIRHLSCMTRLRLRSDYGWVPHVHPFVELSKIRSLQIGRDLVFNHSGEFLFPSFTQLTHLECHGDAFTSGSRKIQALEVVSQYGSTLKSLVFWSREKYGHTNWSMLEGFMNLRCLRVEGLIKRDTHLFPFLLLMPDLTMLTLGARVSYNPPPFARAEAAILSMTQLRSVDYGFLLRQQNPWVFVESPFSQLKFLTELKIRTPPHYDAASICYLTQIRNLRITARTVRGIDASDSLVAMTRLESLALVGAAPWNLDGSAFSSLHNLKSLTVRLARVDEAFFESLCSIAGLTMLDFVFARETETTKIITHVNLLSSLEILTLPQLNCSLAMKCLWEGSLQRLRHLNLGIHPQSREADERALMNRFPLLRSVSYDGWI